MRKRMLDWATGYTRFVLLIGPLAIKFPRIRSARQFVLGLAANLHEYEIAKQTKKGSRLAEVYLGGPSYLLLVCRRYRVLDRALTKEEEVTLGYSNLDTKIGNFGLDETGSLVVLDYGHADFWGVKQ